MNLELADAFIRDSVKDGEEPFQVAWCRSDTTNSIKYIEIGLIDVGITYNEAAEKIAVKQGIATDPVYYAFRDHFLLVGPPSNPANISSETDIFTIFADLHAAAEGGDTELSVRFLSRYDKSATNIKESLLWAGVGQVRFPIGTSYFSFQNPLTFFSNKVPWATAYSPWYHQYIGFPIQALTAAILLGEYTISDRGTILSIDAKLRNQTMIYKAGSDKAIDPLLNPAHLLIGAKAPNPDKAVAFAEWLISPRGQRVVTGFKKSGEQLYSGAPSLEDDARERRLVPVFNIPTGIRLPSVSDR